VAPDLPLPRLLDAFVAARRSHLYVVGPDGRFLGAANLHDVNEALRGTEAPESVLARDVVRPRFETTTPEESLPRVLRRFAEQDCERLPILLDRESRRLVGTISKHDILSVYAMELVQRGGGTRPAGALEPAAGVESLVEEVPLPGELGGKTFGESRFRERFALALLLVRRGTAGTLVPEGSLRFAAGDRLVVFGTPDRVAALRRLAAVAATAGPPHS